MDLIFAKACRVRTSTVSGRGVFATEFIEKGQIIERMPVKAFGMQETEILRRHKLDGHMFIWNSGDEVKSVAIYFGLGTLINHSLKPNCHVRKYIEDFYMDIYAIEDIAPGDELFFKYVETDFN
jgi:SET domain-containing protein